MKNNKVILFVFSLVLSAGWIQNSFANDKIFARQSNQPCWDEAAKYHGVDPWLLYSVAYVESTHNPSAISKTNRNGTYDIGLMQINSFWLPTLKKHGITESHLKNACVSTYVGAWVMAQNIRRYGYSWEAIASYNVGNVKNPNRRRIGYGYAMKVYREYERLSRMNSSSHANHQALNQKHNPAPGTNHNQTSTPASPSSSGFTNDRAVQAFGF